MADEFEGKIDTEGKFELTRSFWKRIGKAFAPPQVSRRLAKAAAKKKVLDWYDIRDYPLDTERKDEFVTGFPRRGGDCILILSITEGATAQIKFDNVNSDSFELSESRRLRHNFSNLYLNNAAQSGATLKLLFGKGDWEVVRHHPEEEIMAINADTVDGLHASASIEAGSLLALGPDGFFPCGAVRCLQNELFAHQPAAPVPGDVFISNDTGELYICFAAGVWTNILTPSADQIAFTPAGDIIATDVQAAIEELDAEKIADIADVIKDTHIDWGTGANQVSAADIPIADPGGIIVATQVEGALQEIMTDLDIAEAAIVIAQATADAAQADIDGFDDELKNLIAHEIQQLETLGAVTTISAAQWGYLGAMNQGVAIGSVPAFLAHAAANQENIAINTEVTVIFGTEIFDIGGNFAANTFTAPVTGKYHFSASLNLINVDSAANFYQISLRTSNRNYIKTIDPGLFSGDLEYWTLELSVIADMDGGDTAHIMVYQGAGAAQTDIQGHGTTIYSWFSGVLVA